MKIIALGDTHGRRLWEGVTASQQFDKLVFIGDYFDSVTISTEDQISNFLDIIAFRQAFPDKVVLLTGNHDFHYMPAALQIGERYTGFQEDHAPQISRLLLQHLSLLQMCFCWQDFLFSHAGITNTWIRNAGYRQGDPETFINELFRSDPAHFMFNGWEPSGESITQSPIWVRPASLKRNAFRYDRIKQVVGHTRFKKLEIVKNRFFFIDTLEYSGQYLVIEEGSAKVETIAGWQ